MDSFKMEIHWQHAILAGAALIILLAPLFFKRFRSTWLVALAIVGMFLVSKLWMRGQNIVDQLSLATNQQVGATSDVVRNFHFQSGQGSMRFSFQHGQTPPLNPNAVIVQSYPVRPPIFPFEPKGRVPGTIVWSNGGFGLILQGPPAAVKRVALLHFWAIMVPHWFVLLCLSVFPIRWIYMRFWGRKAYAKKHNLCAKCGYSLNGLSEPIRCPECGSAKTEALIRLVRS